MPSTSGDDEFADMIMFLGEINSLYDMSVTSTHLRDVMVQHASTGNINSTTSSPASSIESF